MPRPKVIYTDEFPYHIYARTNNKEPFPIPLEEVWEIMTTVLKELSIKYRFQIYAFVLMINHYHLLANTENNFLLNKVMHCFQLKCTNLINRRAGRTNHVFGGKYKASLITNEAYFYHVLKYIYRNPIKAGIIKNAEQYNYSTINTHFTGNGPVPICCPISGIDRLVPKGRENFFAWVNTDISDSDDTEIKKALNKAIFKFRASNNHLNSKLYFPQ